MQTLDRRRFLQGTATAAAGFTLAAPFAALTERSAGADDHHDRHGRGRCDDGFGPLSPRPAENDGTTYLALPAGFKYWAISQVGAPMANGQPTPAAHDGMSAFDGRRGKIVIVRNHEQANGTPFHSPAYDSGASGGTTTLVFDPKDPANPVVTPSLSGTIRNCAGGATPWGSWLTCEETTGDVGGVPHGYIFEVPTSGSSNAVPYKAMGRFAHEAVAVDPKTLAVYETEDAGATSGLYRFRPARTRHGRADLTAGRLSMLAVAGQPSADLYLGQTVGDSYDVEWVDIDPAAVDAPATAAGSAPWVNGRGKGGAAFRRLEGAWWSEEDRAIYFTSTDGGDAASGQVWAYRPNRRHSGPAGTLTLIYESPGSSTLLKPDNLTITPTGGVLLCEDTDNARQTFLRGVSDDGVLYDVAANVRAGLKPDGVTPAMNDEFAGATFSPDGKWLFVNIQTPGVTFAIRGPWCRDDHDD